MPFINNALFTFKNIGRENLKQISIKLFRERLHEFINSGLPL